MTQLFAQPYDISANGFYFETAEEYTAKVAKLRNSYGDPVEEFEIQFIDGEDIDVELFKAVGVYQCNIKGFLSICFSPICSLNITLSSAVSGSIETSKPGPS